MRVIISKINDRILLITLIMSLLIIGIAYLLPIFGVFQMTAKQYFWLIMMVILGYAFPILKTALSDHAFSYQQFINEFYLTVILIISPVIMLLALISIIVSFFNSNPNIHLYLFVFSAAGFFIHSFQHMDEMKEDFIRVNDSIKLSKDNQYNKY